MSNEIAEQPTLGMDVDSGLVETPQPEDQEGLLAGAEGILSEGEPEDPVEEVDYEGKNYKLPKELKGALLRNADYTQKTQALAEQRRALAAQESVIREREQFHEAASAHTAKIMSLADKVQQYQGIDWQAAAATNPAEAQRAFMSYQQAREQLSTAQSELQQMHGIFKQRTQEARETALRAGIEDLKRDIPDFSPEFANKLIDYGSKSFGFHPNELAEITDPRTVKVLHKAYLYDQMQAKQQKPSNAPEPITTVRSTRTAGPSKDPSKMSDKEFADYRRRQIARRG